MSTDYDKHIEVIHKEVFNSPEVSQMAYADVNFKTMCELMIRVVLELQKKGYIS